MEVLNRRACGLYKYILICNKKRHFVNGPQNTVNEVSFLFFKRLLSIYVWIKKSEMFCYYEKTCENVFSKL